MALNKQINVVFVHTPCPELKDDRLEPPLGILYLATLLEKENIPCQVCDLSGIPQNKWREKIIKADVYAFSTYSANYHLTLKIKNIIKELYPNATMIAGGPHVSALAEECTRDFDIIIVGEAECKFIEVIRALQEGKRLVGIFQGEPIMNLDELPFVNYDLVDLSSYNRIVDGSRSISLVSSRGCPYNCEFCNSRVFSRGQLRFRSPKNVAQEIQQLKKKYGVTSFRFNDDLFTFSPERVEEMAEALKPLNIRYRVFARSRSMTETAAKQLYDSGCRHVSIGIESMSERMLRLLKKKTTVKDNIAALSNCKKAWP